MHAAYVHCWRQPLDASVALLEQAHGACLEAGRPAACRLRGPHRRVEQL
ncbi:hypothetical protein LP420_03705 [Massilia sp. B-10]|nr:hypothetical protein LP420_03705 [Massilia sp. B-10]